MKKLIKAKNGITYAWYTTAEANEFERECQDVTQVRWVYDHEPETLKDLNSLKGAGTWQVEKNTNSARCFKAILTEIRLGASVVVLASERMEPNNELGEVAP